MPAAEPAEALTWSQHSRPEVSVSLSDKTTVGDDTAAVEDAAEDVGHVLGLTPRGWLGQGKRLSRDIGHAGITVSLDDVMALQLA